MRSIIRFIARKRLGLIGEYLPGYPEAVPRHLLIGDVLGRFVPHDIRLTIRIFGAGQVRSVMGVLVEKGRLGPGRRKEAEPILREHDQQLNFFKTFEDNRYGCDRVKTEI